MKLSGRTSVFGILGDPVEHSLSPVMQNAAFEEAGLDAVFVPFHVLPADLGSALQGIRALGIRGVNVTIPHKEAVCSLLDDVDERARRIGAVNVIVNQQGRLEGYNTDGSGLLRALQEDLGFSPCGKKVLVLGAGGACRAALVALAEGGASWVGVANRTPENAQTLTQSFGAILPGTAFAKLPLGGTGFADALKGADLLINTTSVGLKGESFADFPWESLKKKAVLYDMVYRPGGTPLVRDARQRGHRAADGLGMLAAQGEEAFFLWTGEKPPSGVMKRRLLAEMVN